MAVNHKHFNDQLHHGRKLRRALEQFEEGRQGLIDQLGIIEQMRDGDGSVAAHYAYATTKYGCASDADMKAIYDDLKAAITDRINTNASVSNVKVALDLLSLRFA